MDIGRVTNYLALGLVVVLAAMVLLEAPIWLGPIGEYDRTTVSAVDENGTQLATVDVRIADTQRKQKVGLGQTESLENGTGMLFVFDSEGIHTFVMRDMSFPLDIVFVDANGTVTKIHHAPVPEEIPGGNGNFPGRGKYVLEVDRGWANATGVDPGDRIDIPATVAGTE